jgi:hypothetical protein
LEVKSQIKLLRASIFPIGVPTSYRRRVDLVTFVCGLSKFGNTGWEEFYEVASQRSEIALTGPFYPARPGGTKRAHQIDALGLDCSDDLLRVCEKISHASPLFWTLGAKQVGRAESSDGAKF